MALIKNTRVQPLELNAADKTLKIPGGVDGPEGFAPGYANAEDDFLAEAKKNPVVKWYFDEGILVAEKTAAPKKGEADK